MYRSLMSLFVVCLVLMTSAAALANDYLVGGMFSTPAVAHYRVAAAPVYAAAPYTAYRPIVAQPVTTFSPVIAPVAPVGPVTYASPVPVTAYSPVVVPAPVVATRPVVVARPVVTRTKFYVPGQPIRNVFRWIGPGVPTGVAVMP